MDQYTGLWLTHSFIILFILCFSIFLINSFTFYRHGAEELEAVAPSTSGSRAFHGTGYRLGETEGPLESVAGPSLARARPQVCSLCLDGQVSELIMGFKHPVNRMESPQDWQTYHCKSVCVYFSYLKLDPGQTYTLSPNTKAPWEIPQQAVLHNQAKTTYNTEAWASVSIN